jgi:hypothetical protein
MLITFILSGCGNDPVQEDLLEYLNEELPAISDIELDAVNAYQSVTGVNYQDDYIMYDTLVYDVVPTYQQFLDELEAIELETEELREIHETYIDGANLQYNAFVRIITALEEQDFGKIEEANEMLNDARKQMRDFNNQIVQIAEEHSVELTEPLDHSTL